ncbi:hypothetical protein DNTS_005531 [Danionella cerebrum]|uniref:LEM domain-containing protein n=1 Tax=Danionella cerebrum TaxID=2873325 RepID=A0A553NJT5_9TELE|nr:hypothetical protein DNTS_005531 [Danionella translucida]
MAMGSTEMEQLLMNAVRETDHRSVQSLLFQGADANTQVLEGVAAVHLAAGKDSERGGRILELLLRHGADANLRTSEGMTPLHVAASWGCLQNLQLLLKHGGDPDLPDQDGNKPSDLAEQEENRKCAILLQEHERHTSCEKQRVIEQPLLLSRSFSPEPSDLHRDPLSSTRLSSASSGQLQNFTGSALPQDHQNFWGSRLSPLSEDYQNQRGTKLSPISLNHQNLCPPGFLDSGVWNSTWEKGAFHPVLSSTHVSTYPDDTTTGGDQEGPEPDNLVNPLDYPQNLRDLPVPVGTGPRRSVSFAAGDHYFSALSPEDHSHHQDSDQTLDLSCYSEFVDRERMATVLQNHGIDVTSPDRVFVFCKDADKLMEDSEKTLLGPGAIEEEEEESTVSSESSRYSSCSSDPNPSPAIQNQSDTGNTPIHPSGNTGDPSLSSCVNIGNPDLGSCVNTENSTLGCSANTGNSALGCSSSTGSKTPTCGGHLSIADGLVAAVPEQFSSEDVGVTLRGRPGKEEDDCVVSPFVTGRTQSRLSRHSERMNMSALQNRSSLFEETLPKPERSHTPRNTLTHSHQHFQYTPLIPLSPSLSADSPSQEDSDIQSESMADTVLIAESVSENAEEFRTSAIGPEEDIVTSAAEEQQKSRSFGASGAAQILTSGASSSSEGVQTISSAQHTDPRVSRVQQTISRVVCESPVAKSSKLVHPEPSGHTPRYSLSRLSRRISTGLHKAEEPEEYLYTDTEEGHELIETRVPPRHRTSGSSLSQEPQCEETLLYDWRSLTLQPLSQEDKQYKSQLSDKSRSDLESPSSKSPVSPPLSGLTDRELRNKLVAAGEDPGPINPQTRALYIQRLRRALQRDKHSNKNTPRPPHCKNTPHTPGSPHPKKKEEQCHNSNTGFSPELELVLTRSVLPDSQEDELALNAQFERPDQNQQWREGSVKSSFNYLLLDPRVTQNLPLRSESLSVSECFQIFLSAVFYIGKGKRSRPYSHLYEALEYHRGDKTARKLCSKVQRILQIWRSGHGVVSLHCFQNVIPVEAYTREACMVEAMGLKNLTNLKRGDYYGVVSKWPLCRRRELGVHLLFRAMKIFLLEGERQLRPTDI